MPAIYRVIACYLFAAAMWSGDAADAQDFRVENKVFFPGEPASASTTLFAAGKAYDFLDGQQETIVFDKANGLITILDQARKIRTDVTMGVISTEIGRLYEAARNSRHELVRMSASPQFSEAADAKTGQLTLDSEWTKYVVDSEAPKNPFSALQYAEFADWAVQLAALLNPPNLPFARMKVNELLKKRREFPVKIERTLRAEGRAKPLIVRSEHRFQSGLVPADKERLANVEKQLAEFQQVSWEEFRR